ncbi:hypothetical protein [Neobacillus drentensis]|uniref:hypothetical protein n=1 Tax=Neobacillus drentensis TaxID=220684 RepID=UPI002FFE6186
MDKNEKDQVKKQGFSLGEIAENERIILVRELSYGMSSAPVELFISEVDSEEAYRSKIVELSEYLG